MSINLTNVFMSLLDNFMIELENSFPHEGEIKIARSSIKMLGLVNPKMIIEEFVNSVSPYKKQLFEKDHEFFMNLNNLDLDETTALKGLKIIELLKNTSAENTDIMFNYIQKLFKLGEKISS